MFFLPYREFFSVGIFCLGSNTSPVANYLLILFDSSIYLYKRGVLNHKIKLIF